MLNKINKRQAVKIKKRALLNLFESMPGRIEMLTERERALVNLFLSSQKFRHIALTAGIDEATIARRLKRIAARLASNDYVRALTNKNLTPLKMQILRGYFIEGRSMLQIARDYNFKYCKVRKIIKEHAFKNENMLQEQNSSI
ncbi:MAG: hypothetical protein ABFD79_07965 [Phycisphaerales bacterium]